MRVIIKEPNEDARVEYIDNTLDELQSIVGGYIEVVPLTFDSVIICNEEGKLRDLPFNFHIPVDYIVGTAIICDDNEDGEFVDVSVTIEEFNKILKDWGNDV